jgi:hypothetical protein
MNAKELALAHFEKAILGVCAVVMIYFLVAALSIKPYAKKPEEFTSATNAAKTYVNNDKRGLPDTESKAVAVVDLASETNRLFRTLDPRETQEFSLGQAWQRPFDYGMFRNEPKLLAAGKPEVQENRGLLETYLIDQDGNTRKRKVKKSKARATHDDGDKFSGMSGQGWRKSMEEMMKKRGIGAGGSDMEQRMRGRMGRGGMSGGPGMGGMGGMMGGRGAGGEGMMGGNEGFMGGDEAPKGIDVGRPPNRFILGDKKKKDEKKTDGEDTEVEEKIESREGFRWVEICAPFPHAEQLVEFVKALQEPVQQTKLYYQSVQVQRRELTPSLTWSEWKDVDVKQQFDIIQSALNFTPDTSLAILPGLAMGVPDMIVAQRLYMHKQEGTNIGKLYSKVEKAKYLPEIINPLAAEERKARERQIDNERNFMIDKKKKKEEKQEPVFLPEGGGKKMEFQDPNKRKETGSNHANIKTALIRYWDFTVEPGRRYQYRLRVVVWNPNYKRQDVSESALSERLLLEGPWSEPSDEILVDADNHWYVADHSKPSAKSRSASEVNLEVHHWHRDMGEWLVTTFAQRPGQIVGLAAPAGQKEKTKILKWNDKDRIWEAREQKLESEFDTGTLLLSVSEPRYKEEIQGRQRTLVLPRESIGLNQYGDLVRHEESVDVDDETRKGVVDHYKELMSKIENQTEGEKPGAGGGGDPTSGRGGKRGAMKGGKGSDEN